MRQIRSVASEYKPWRKDLPWYWVGLQGAIALGIGIYFIAAPDSANSTIRLLLAILLVVSSVSDILAGVRNYGNPAEQLPMTPYLLVRGGAGVTLGLLFFLATRSDYIADGDARYILGYGLIAYAIIGLIAVIMAMIKGQMHWMAVVTNLLFLLIGAVLIYNNRESVEAERSVRYLGWAAVIGGGILLAYTYILKRNQEAEAAYGFDPVSLLAPAAAVDGRGVARTSDDAWRADALDSGTGTAGSSSTRDSTVGSIELASERDRNEPGSG